MFKFYTYFYKLEGSGLTGIYITVIMIVSIMMFSGYCFYRYMVFTFMEGRILDLYRRLSGTYKDFFLPHDNEVSLKYLQWVLERYRQKNCVIMSELRTLKDKYGIDRNINFIQLFTILDGIIMKNRLFFKDFDGSIIEVPQRKVALQTHELKKVRKEATEGGAHLYGSKYRSLNSVVKSTYRTMKTNARADFNASMDEKALGAAFDHKGAGGAGFEGAGDLAALRRMQKKEKDVAKEYADVVVEDSAQKPLLIEMNTDQD